jgi:hypothetical protein
MTTMVLQGFHTGIAQELQFHIESASGELIQFVAKKIELHKEYTMTL